MFVPNRAVVAGGLLALLIGLAASARAAVNLEWRVDSAGCIGRSVDVGLYAVSSGPDESLAALEAIVTWDAARLEFQSVVSNGPYTWLSSGLPVDAGLDGLNTSTADGTALYQALSQIGSAAQATPAGLLVATFRFRQLSGVSSDVSFTPTAGTYSRTVVYGTAAPNTAVTGSLTPASVVPLPGMKGDSNCDGTVDNGDIDCFVQALLDVSGVLWQSCAMTTNPACDYDYICANDLNEDGTVDNGDIDAFVGCLTALPAPGEPCP